MSRAALAFWAGLALLLLVVGLAAGRQGRSGGPLDPDSTDQNGTAALLVLLDQFGADVERGLPTVDTAITLMLADRLSDEQRTDMERWIEGGGTLVVTDPSSSFAPRPGPLPELARGTLGSQRCTVAALQGLTMEASSFVLYPQTPRPAPDPGDNPGDDPDPVPTPPFTVDDRCFGEAHGDYLQLARRGAGQVIALGGGQALTNRYLDESDNAVLAVQLLVVGKLGALDALSAANPPQFGGGGPRQPVTVLYEPVGTVGPRTLGDLIPTGVKWSAWELVAAFAVFVLWRARRLGQPVLEPQPVELPGSLLVRATGELRRRSGGHGEASAVLRQDLERRLRRQFKVAPEMTTDDLVTVTVSATGLVPDVVTRALSGSPSAGPADLTALVADIDLVNRTVTESESAPSSNHHPATAVASSGEPT